MLTTTIEDLVLSSPSSAERFKKIAAARKRRKRELFAALEKVRQALKNPTLPMWEVGIMMRRYEQIKAELEELGVSVRN